MVRSPLLDWEARWCHPCWPDSGGGDIGHIGEMDRTKWSDRRCHPHHGKMVPPSLWPEFCLTHVHPTSANDQSQCNGDGEIGARVAKTCQPCQSQGWNRILVPYISLQGQLLSLLSLPEVKNPCNPCQSLWQRSKILAGMVFWDILSLEVVNWW